VKVAVLALMMMATQALAAPIEPGSGHQTAALDGTKLEVFTYRPAGCAPTGFLLVFHGIGRNADGYRDHARPLADRLCLIVAAPLFDEARFPSWRYQRGGIVHDHVLQPQADWTGEMVPRLAAWLRANQGPPGMPYALLGHSAGAQFLGRVAAYTPTEATRIVLANPSTYVLPSLEHDPPYGFRGLPDAESLLRRYLALPLTVLLGEADVLSKDLADDAAARAQGATRLERGRRTFAMAQAAAEQHGWPLNWRLLTVPFVGHDATAMFASPQAVQAMKIGDDH
jgi:dienelactone hydrolase